MRAWMIALFGMATQSGYTGPAPTGPPTNGSSSLYANPKIKIALNWKNGDRTAYTRIYRLGVLVNTVRPGETYYETGLYTSGSDLDWTIYHYKNGQESTGLAISYPNT